MKRFDYIDLAKGLGMLTIIWGHIHSGASTHILYAFHIPLFFFLSGLVFSPERYDCFKTFLARRWKSLLFPYIVFSVFTWLIWAAYSHVSHAEVDSYLKPLLETFLAQGSEGYLVHNVPLWFVTCLFVVEVLYFFIAKLPVYANIATCTLLGALGVWMSVSPIDFSTLPWSVDVAFAALPFYALGHLLVQKTGHERLMGVVTQHRISALAVLAIATFLLILGGLKNSQVSMGHAVLGDQPWLFYPVALCGITAFMVLCLLIVSYERLRRNRITEAAIGFGKTSFRAMAVHNPIKGFLLVLLAKAMHSSVSVLQTGVAGSLAAFVLTVTATWLVIKGIEVFLHLVFHRNSILP